LDLLLAESYPALQFAVTHRDELFPNVPIVFFGVDARRIAGQKIWPGVTGVTETVDVRGTINLALHLHPNTSTVAVITNRSEFEDYWLGVVHDALLRDHSDLKEVDLVALSTSQLLDRVAALPLQTVVLFQRAPLDSVRPAMGDYDIVAWVGQRLPTYCIFPTLCLSHGGIGGVETAVYQHIALAMQLAGRVLVGERPADIPVVRDSNLQARVDWRQLQKWHIPESALPPGSVVLYRQPTMWERDWRYIIPAILLILAQALLIIGLLWQRARKRKAEAVLRESEKRFRVMADTTPSLVWMCDPRGRITYLNERRTAFTGPDPDAGYGDSWAAYIHPDDLKNVLDTVAQALKARQSFSREYRLRRSDGVYRWMLDVASPRVNGDGSFAGFIGSAIDVTDQKLAQQALEKVSGQLIEAQEKERSRIARELHDDICQRLALLSMELEQADRVSRQSPEAAKKNMDEIRSHCSEIAGDVQSLSHQLHSSKLDYLGAASAIRGFCQEFSRQHEVNIEFTENNVPRELPKDISLCLFRVTQEALHNAVKYSEVSEFRVELTATGDEIHLIVKDEGTGFNVEQAKKGSGLGLVSMQERVHLVHGSLCVESKPGTGTSVLAVIPVTPENERSSDTTVEDTVSTTGMI
jgi:PAS domain S-box-containing protein